MPGKVIAITGIDTGIGKTVVTGFLARVLMKAGMRVITQKPVETGGSGVSADIRKHREMMGIPLQDVDRDGTTCSYLFSCPASPHLAAVLEKRSIDISVLDRATQSLSEQYGIVLLEGAGGLLVPFTGEMLFADYAQERSYPLILVSSSRLGSINHTLLSLEACRNRDIDLCALFYNRAGGSDKTIADDTFGLLQKAVRRYGFTCPVIDIPVIGSVCPDMPKDTITRIIHES